MTSGTNAVHYGGTVADLLRFMRQARGTVQVPVRFNSAGDLFHLMLLKSSVRRALDTFTGTSILPSEYDPATRLLSLATVDAIRHSEGRS